MRVEQHGRKKNPHSSQRTATQVFRNHSSELLGVAVHVYIVHCVAVFRAKLKLYDLTQEWDGSVPQIFTWV